MRDDEFGSAERDAFAWLVSETVLTGAMGVCDSVCQLLYYHSCTAIMKYEFNFHNINPGIAEKTPFDQVTFEQKSTRKTSKAISTNLH